MRKAGTKGYERDGGSILSNISPNVSYLDGRNDKTLEKRRAAVRLNTDEEQRNKTELSAENLLPSDNSSCRSGSAESAIIFKQGAKDHLTISPSISSLFIGDLDKGVTEKMLLDTFSNFKSLASVKICLDSETKLSLGYGYLNFTSAQEADEAIEKFSYVKLFGKEVRIMPSMRNSYFRKNIGTNVFFSNLPLENPALTTRVFYESFREYGRVLSCKLDRRKNIGFVYFESDVCAKKAIDAFNSKEYFGSKIACGLHFDKDIRKSPQFEKRRSKLEGLTVIKESLESEACTDFELFGDNSGSGNPNSVHVKNLPVGVCNEDLLNYFSKVGPIKSVFTSKVDVYTASWGFITYKRGKDTIRALEELNGVIFMGKRIEVTRAVKSSREGKNFSANNKSIEFAACGDSSTCNKQINSLLSNGYRQTLYLSDMSAVCNQKFLGHLCRIEKIRFQKIAIDRYDKESLTFGGSILCKSRPDANRLFEVLNGKLIGDSIVKVSWRPGSNNFKKLIKQDVPGVPRERIHSMNSNATSYSLVNGESHAIHSAPYNLMTNMKNKRSDPIAKSQLIDVLKREVKDSIDFMKSPDASREVNLACISEYIFDVYWRSDLESLTKFLLLMPTKKLHHKILRKQVHEAIKFLGFHF
ncbi:LAQU0S02e03554g1_1 [Lachancea quebecensis]|uniref:LAQU0S02e03554g1_1 n=1 Tax=Lachancea quebecensis TaxID=1654605 RepID=A0A0P1KMQ7_9SACH|nr:LAQU0S02e03554g1_1 [Lachancea quebecensis]